MFRRKNKNIIPAKKAALSIMAPGSSFTGRVFLQTEARIGGTIQGFIVTQSHLVIEETAKIFGDIQAKNVEIYGYVKGDVHAEGQLRVSATGHIEGQITTRNLIVEAGAKILGQVGLHDQAVPPIPSEPKILDSESDGAAVSRTGAENLSEVYQ